MTTPENPPSVPRADTPQAMTIDQAVATAYAHWNAGQLPPAEQLCRQVLNAWPEHPGAMHLMGLLAFTAGNLPLAVQYTSRACASPSAPPLFYSNLAEMLRQQGSLVEAEAAARQALQLDNQLPAGWTNLGIVLQEAGKLEESLECLIRATAINPDSPENHNNLGNTLKRLGRLDDAQAEYRTAIALKPSYCEAHNNLGYLLCSLGELDSALSEIRQAISLNPRYVDAYINAAAISLAMGIPAEALRWLSNLANFAPTHPGGLIAQARALIDCGREAEALEVARRAFAAAPNNGETAEVLANVLGLRGAVSEALEAYAKAAKLPHPQQESILIGKANLLGETGLADEALQGLGEALAINPCSARALFNRAAIKAYKTDAAEIARMEGLLHERKVVARDDVVMLHFALGKACLQAGDVDRAFAHFAEGNHIKRSTFAYDAAGVENWMASIQAVFNDGLFERLVTAGDPSDFPVFVMGMPRSGTTLIEQILASHAKVHGAGELRVMQSIADFTTGPDQRPVGYPRLSEVLRHEEAGKLGKIYVSQVQPLAPGKLRIVDKMPANFLYAGLIHTLLPNARIIHVQRDAMDTCTSCYTTLFAGEQKFSYDLKELGRFYKSYQSLTAHWRKMLPQDRLLEVRYEDVVGDVEGQTKRMLDFIGLDWDHACLNFFENRRQVRTASFEDVRRPAYSSSIGRWKTYAEHLRPLMDALGVAQP